MDIEIKNKVLVALKELVKENRQSIIETNKKDVAAFKGDDESMLDRLKVDDKKVNGMIAAIEQVLSFEDPENKLLYQTVQPNGLKVENRTVPFGTILIIYESRPDVTIEAAITAFKAGNKILLKGGKEARLTNLLLTELWQKALVENNVSENYVSYLDIGREAIQKLIKENNKTIDLIIPRGGDALINFVVQNANVPVMVSGRGNNFLYIDVDSDFDMAIDIIINGKSRISVCNALDKVLINKNLHDLPAKLNKLVNALKEKNIEIIGSKEIVALNNSVELMPNISVMEEEFLALKILIDITDNLNAAIKTINQYSGGHSAVIITADDKAATQFQHEVDCAAVYHNASTRFTDGGEFGLGAEIAISTQKLHFRGPVGLNQLVTNKWFVSGNGQVR